ncbi:hypothetical protein P9869_24600 [Streptomyces ossamyceticus]|nr:hypothetical protein [Streptomyces ossamyceticus]
MGSRETLVVARVEPQLVVEVGVDVTRDAPVRWRHPAGMRCEEVVPGRTAWRSSPPTYALHPRSRRGSGSGSAFLYRPPS